MDNLQCPIFPPEKNKFFDIQTEHENVKDSQSTLVFVLL